MSLSPFQKARAAQKHDSKIVKNAFNSAQNQQSSACDTFRGVYKRPTPSFTKQCLTDVEEEVLIARINKLMGRGMPPTQLYFHRNRHAGLTARQARQAVSLRYIFHKYYALQDNSMRLCYSIH